MTTEQEGAPPASAGGAPAPDLIGTVRNVDGVLFVLGHNPDYGRRWWPVEGGGQYEDGEQWRQDNRPKVGVVPGTPAAQDPRDAEIEQLRAELDRVSGGWEARVEGRQKLTQERDQALADLHRIRDIALVVLNVLPDDDDRSAVDLVREILESAGPEKLRRDNQFRGLVVERDRKRRELADVTAERDDYARRLRDTDAAYAKVTAERDSLRQELDLIGERHAAGLVVLRQDFTAAVNGLLPKPAEPRGWSVGDAEPEIGTTVRTVGGRTYTRRTAGDWHRNGFCLKGDLDDCGEAGYSWAGLVQKPGGLVEVVSTDG